MIKLLQRYFKNNLRKTRISISLTHYHRLHGSDRRIPVKQGGKVVDYIFLPYRKPLKTIASEVKKMPKREVIYV